MPKSTVICVDMDKVEYEVPVSDLSWRPSAYGIVMQGDKVLLSKQFNGYDLPGGGLDLGETPEDAVIREIREETGIVAENPELLDVKTSFFKQTHKDGSAVQSLQMYYRCGFVGGTLSIDGFDEHEKNYADMPEWFLISRLETIIVANSFDWRPLVIQAAKA